MAYELSENEEEVSDESKIERLSHALTEVETCIVIDALRHYRDTSLVRAYTPADIARVLNLFAESV